MKVKRKTRIRWGRVLWVLMIITLTIGVMWYETMLPTTVNVPKPMVVTYVVEDGDSLWSIAKRAYGESVDVDKAMQEIKQLNQLESDTVAVGKELKLQLTTSK